MPKKSAEPTITHHGVILFDFAAGAYKRASGAGNWGVRPIDWPGLPQPPPLGQVLIEFASPIRGPYTVIVSPSRTPDAPMLTCNYGNVLPGSCTFPPDGAQRKFFLHGHTVNEVPDEHADADATTQHPWV